MGCDRNLFTLRLVLNQTQGKWQWQAAAEGWGGGQVQQRKMAKVCHVTQVQQYTPPIMHPPPAGQRVISKALGIKGASKGWMKRTNSE